MTLSITSHAVASLKYHLSCGITSGFVYGYDGLFITCCTPLDSSALFPHPIGLMGRYSASNSDDAAYSYDQLISLPVHAFDLVRISCKALDFNETCTHMLTAAGTLADLSAPIANSQPNEYKLLSLASAASSSAVVVPTLAKSSSSPSSPSSTSRTPIEIVCYFPAGAILSDCFSVIRAKMSSQHTPLSHFQPLTYPHTISIPSTTADIPALHSQLGLPLRPLLRSKPMHFGPI